MMYRIKAEKILYGIVASIWILCHYEKANVSIVVATKMRASENKLVTDSQFLFIYFISSEYRYMIQWIKCRYVKLPNLFRTSRIQLKSNQFIYIYIYISNEKTLLEYQKKCCPSLQEVYSRNKKQSNTKTTSIHQKKICKNRMTAYYRQPIQ